MSKHLDSALAELSTARPRNETDGEFINNVLHDVRAAKQEFDEMLAACKKWLEFYDACLRLDADDAGIAEMRAAVAKAR